MTDRAPRTPPTAPARLLVHLAVALGVLALTTVAVSGQTYLVGEVAPVEAANAVPTWAGWPFRIVMQAGTIWVGVVVAVAVAVATWRARGPVPTAAIGVSVAVAYRLDNVLKAVIERPRPPGRIDGLQVREHIGGFGYPSGHTTMACALAAGLHPLLSRRGRVVVWTLAVIVAVTRMHVGVHWPADLVGGAALGIAIASAAWLVVGCVAAVWPVDRA